MKEELLKLREELKDIERYVRITKGVDFCKYLEDNGIYYDLCIKHNEVLGCDESEVYYRRYEQYLDKSYSICKNLFVHERKGEKRNFLIITRSDKKVDLKSIKDTLDCKKLEFVSNDDMKEILDTEPGNVSLFNIINDKDKRVNLIIDEELLDEELLAFHPLYNGMSIFISPEECKKFLRVVDRDASIVKIENKAMQKVMSM